MAQAPRPADRADHTWAHAMTPQPAPPPRRGKLRRLLKRMLGRRAAEPVAQGYSPGYPQGYAQGAHPYPPAHPYPHGYPYPPPYVYPQPYVYPYPYPYAPQQAPGTAAQPVAEIPPHSQPAADPATAERPAEQPPPAAEPRAEAAEPAPAAEPEATPEPRGGAENATTAAGATAAAAAVPARTPSVRGAAGEATTGTATATATRPGVSTATMSQRPDLVTTALANLAIRDLTLVESVLDIVEELEDSTEDAELLEKLFKVDNLATRMRRNGENLLVLAGQETEDPRLEPVTLLDVSRAAISEIKDYNRVQVGRLPEKAVAGHVADDLSHLIAELLDNATAKSPEHSQVVIAAQIRADGGLLLSVEDEGIGIPERQLAELNARLSGSPVLDEGSMRHMGLYVASRIAHRHGLEVQLETRAFRGISAFVVIPDHQLREPLPESPSPEAEKPRMPTPEPRPEPRPAPATVGADVPTVSGGPRPRNGEASSYTAAGLPRRSAHSDPTDLGLLDKPPAATTATTTAPADQEQEEHSGRDRAEQIRDEIGSFLDGEREASAESGQ